MKKNETSKSSRSTKNPRNSRSLKNTRSKRRSTQNFSDSKILNRLSDQDDAIMAETTTMDFTELGLDDTILRALKTLKFQKPTPIQEKAIPLAIEGKDIIAGSATGSGKTLAFGAGIIQKAKKGAGVQALILTPTRELAVQVSESIKIFAQNKHLKVIAIYGGVSINPQMRDLKRADVVVATPGRMLDHIKRGTAKLTKVNTLVLDEADTMLDMGFIKDVERIIKACPTTRQTLLFSATITSDVASLAKRHTKDPVKIFTNSLVDPGKLTQVSYDVAKGLKFSLLVHLLKNDNTELAMVFCNTRRITDMVTKSLALAGIKAKAIHGGLSQDKRNKVIKNFHSKRVDVLICTDVAARGLDIPDVSHVYNYDIPADSKQYIHRIGRTARAGKEGKAVNILSKRDYENYSKVLKDNSIKVVKEKAPYVERAQLLN